MLAECIGSAELLELAGRKASHSMRLRAMDMPRLACLLALPAAGDTADLSLKLSFLESPERFPEVRIEVQGSLALVCQRCLGPVSWKLELDVRLVVLDSEAELKEVPDPFDCVVMDQQGLRLAVVIEDEILAGLPIAPMHSAGRECGTEVQLPQDAGENGEQSFTTRPFADLATLVGQSGGQRGKDRS